MTLPSFPLALSDFALTLLVKGFEWRLEEQQETSGFGGRMLVVDLAPRFWRSRVEIDHMDHQQASEVQALIESLDGSINTFYFHDPRKPFPAYDPKGTILGANTVRIAETNANNKWVKLKGLPAGYKLTRGDMFDRNFGSNPVHRGLNRIASASVTADGAGNTDWIEFRPHLEPGSAAVDDVINFRQPSALCRLQPKSFNPGQSRGTRNYGMSFEIRQEL